MLCYVRDLMSRPEFDAAMHHRRDGTDEARMGRGSGCRAARTLVVTQFMIPVATTVGVDPWRDQAVTWAVRSSDEVLSSDFARGGPDRGAGVGWAERSGSSAPEDHVAVSSNILGERPTCRTERAGGARQVVR